jgi:wyosine [tRNA(Phe)-imidazoG37] synthetase (radical SAM superfamily)
VLAHSTTACGVLGYALGAVVVLIAAVLLLTIIAIARRIVRSANEIVAALDATRENTNAMFDVPAVNHSIDRITRGLRTAREGL